MGWTRQCHSGSSKNGLDRLSGLHLPLLHHILSFLPCQYVVQTCVLSKCWRNVWCSVPSLHLDDQTFQDEGQEFGLKSRKFVDFLLRQRDGSAIGRFCLKMPKIAYHMSKVNAWITYALRHNVQVIDVEYIEYGDIYDDYGPDMELTPLLFNCASLTELTICLGMNEVLHLPTSICLQALKVMHLMNVALYDVEISEAFFSSSLPSLETLILENCSLEHHKLSIISARKLKKLTMMGTFPASLEISAPNLISLKLDEYGQSTTISFDTNLIHLVDAYIDVDISCFESMGNLFAALKSTVSLTLGYSFLLTLMRRWQIDVSFLNPIHASFPNIRWLSVDFPLSGCQLLVISTILGYCPGIESLAVAIRGEHSWPQSEGGKIWLKSDLSHLESVQIKGFRASENVAEFVKHIVENAPTLKNLTFSTI